MSETEHLAQRRPFSLLILSLVIGTAWLSCLLWLTLAFSNPVTLNRAQILGSDAVLLGQFQQAGFNFSQSWGKQPDTNPVRLRNIRLASLLPEPNQDYLVPIVFSGEKIDITPSRIREIPLIYPASDKIIDDLKLLLKEAGK